MLQIKFFRFFVGMREIANRFCIQKSRFIIQLDNEIFVIK